MGVISTDITKIIYISKNSLKLMSLEIKHFGGHDGMFFECHVSDIGILRQKDWAEMIQISRDN